MCPGGHCSACCLAYSPAQKFSWFPQLCCMCLFHVVCKHVQQHCDMYTQTCMCVYLQTSTKYCMCLGTLLLHVSIFWRTYIKLAEGTCTIELTGWTFGGLLIYRVNRKLVNLAGLKIVLGIETVSSQVVLVPLQQLTDRRMLREASTQIIHSVPVLVVEGSKECYHAWSGRHGHWKPCTNWFFCLLTKKKKLWQPKQKDARNVLPETCGPARLQLLAPDLRRCSSQRRAHSHCATSRCPQPRTRARAASHLQPVSSWDRG